MSKKSTGHFDLNDNEIFEHDDAQQKIWAENEKTRVVREYSADACSVFNITLQTRFGTYRFGPYLTLEEMQKELEYLKK